MKKFIALTLALLMVLSLCACGAKPAETPAETPAEAPAEQPAEAPAEEIVINFPSIWVGTDSKANYMAKMVEDFNAENAGSIKVVVEEQTDYQAYRDKIRTLVTTGDVPDVCILDGTYDVQAYTASGKFMDFAPYLADGWGEDFTEGFADPYTIDGQTCILPFESAIFPLVYNTEILAECGYETFPFTYAEMLDMFKTIKSKGYNAMGQMAGENGWSSMLWYSLIVQAIGGKEAFENGLSDPAFIQAAEILKEMYSYTFDGAVSAGAGDVNGHFIDRSTAVYLNGPWWIKNLYKEDNAVDGVLLADVCDVAANPVFEGGKGEGGVVTAIQGALACAKQSDPAKEAAVIKFIKYISDPQRISEWSLDSGAMFFVKYEASPDTTVIAQKFAKIASDATFTTLHVNGTFPTAFSTEFPAAVSALALGEIDAQGFVDQLQTAIDNAE